MKKLLHVLAGILFGFPFIIGVLDIALRLLRASPVLSFGFIVSLSASMIFYVMMLKEHKST